MVVKKQEFLRLRLSDEASKRIKQRIASRQLSIFKKNCPDRSLDCNELISENAVATLENIGLSIKGVDGSKNVENWLSGTTKELPVFKALCNAVDEEWFDAFDRSLLEEILAEERDKTRSAFINSFFRLFALPENVREYVFSKHAQIIDTVLNGEEIDPTAIEKWIDLFLTELAVNGRQIEFRIVGSSQSFRLISVRIEGKNQMGELAVWHSDHLEPNSTSIQTKGWWWKGLVKIEFQYGLNSGEVIGDCRSQFIPAQGYIDALVEFDCDHKAISVD